MIITFKTSSAHGHSHFLFNFLYILRFTFHNGHIHRWSTFLFENLCFVLNFSLIYLVYLFVLLDMRSFIGRNNPSILFPQFNPLTVPPHSKFKFLIFLKIIPMLSSNGPVIAISPDAHLGLSTWNNIPCDTIDRFSGGSHNWPILALLDPNTNIIMLGPEGLGLGLCSGGLAL